MISRRRVGVASAVVAGGLVVAGLLGLATGPAPISPGDVVAALVGRARSDLAATVVLELRLPRVLLAALAGGGLAVAGAAFQALTPEPAGGPRGAGGRGRCGAGRGPRASRGARGVVRRDGRDLGRRVRGCAGRGDGRVPDRHGGRVAARPDSPPGRGHHRPLLLGRDHSGRVARGLRPARRDPPLADGEPRHRGLPRGRRDRGRDARGDGAGLRAGPGAEPPRARRGVGPPARAWRRSGSSASSSSRRPSSRA